ncbi:MAG TPA: hypothetical protein VNV66_01935 [Pilimelia sp.]|nr:hypothetical protein [Pilimelia sp.]
MRDRRVLRGALVLLVAGALTPGLPASAGAAAVSGVPASAGAAVSGVRSGVPGLAGVAEPGPAATLSIRYNAGDSDPAAPPNSFVVEGECSVPTTIEYRWGSEHGRISACRAQAVSLAPLGEVSHALWWRVCRLMRYKGQLLPHCDEPRHDVVRTSAAA